MGIINWEKAPVWADRVIQFDFGAPLLWSDGCIIQEVGKIINPISRKVETVSAYIIERRPDAWKEGEKRMNNIAQNGNDGHYERKVVEHDKKNKYSRKIKTISLGNADHAIYADVYDVLTAFEVVNPAMAHAVKKMLAPGQRGAKGTIQDMREAVESIERAIELEAGDNDK